uniref:Uncharacterized protein n=1 Tax=Arundo donax TaxID=35708 RepID=A0A0A8YYD7_ARUDO
MKFFFAFKSSFGRPQTLQLPLGIPSILLTSSSTMPTWGSPSTMMVLLSGSSLLNNQTLNLRLTLLIWGSCSRPPKPIERTSSRFFSSNLATTPATLLTELQVEARLAPKLPSASYSKSSSPSSSE